MLGRIVIGICVMFGMIGVSFAQQSGVVNPIGIQWNANTESDLAGYKVYQKVSGGTYSELGVCPKDVTQLLFTSETPHPDGAYSWVSTAFDEAGNESGYSNEVTASFNTSAPAPPTGCIAIPPNP